MISTHSKALLKCDSQHNDTSKNSNLSVVMLKVVMLNVVMLNVVAPLLHFQNGSQGVALNLTFFCNKFLFHRFLYFSAVFFAKHSNENSSSLVNCKNYLLFHSQIKLDDV
jgi:hypothetical protein